MTVYEIENISLGKKVSDMLFQDEDEAVKEAGWLSHMHGWTYVVNPVEL